MRYRPEIDGLRALAVAPVVLFHAGVPFFDGGFVGVDVFFVISGFLITSIIFDEIRAGRFSIVGFYERRARRILPPLLFVCFATVPFAWFWMMPDEFERYARSLLAVNLFSSNILFWAESGYFDASAELKPLLHTWSLAVEEQFYILFPLVLIVLRRWRSTTILLSIVAFCVGGVLLAEIVARVDPSANFYLLPTRAWELGVGAAVAVWMRGRSPRPGALSEIGAGFGLALVLLAVFRFDESFRFPGLWAVVPVLGAALIVLCAVKGTVAARALSWSPFVGVGLISYSLYLWHQPLFAFARLRLMEPPSAAVYAVLIIAATALAYLSWRYVERPFRDRSAVSRGRVFGSAAGASGLLIVFAAFGLFERGFPDRFDGRALIIAAVSGTRAYGLDRDCGVGTWARQFDPETICVHGDGGRLAFLWGDSHADAITPMLADVMNARGASLAQVTARGCAPIIGYEWLNNSFNCVSKLTAMREHILAKAEPGDVVFVHGRWTTLMDPRPFDNGEGGVEAEPVAAPVVQTAPELSPADPFWADAMGELLERTMASLLAADLKVVLIYPVPEAGWDAPRHLSRRLLFSDDKGDLSTDVALFDERAAPAYALLDRIDGEAIARVYPGEALCDRSAGRCAVSEDGWPLYFDDDHLSAAGALKLRGAVEAALDAKGWSRGAPD